MWRTAVFKDSYINTHALRGAFIAHQLQNLADLISEQGKMVLENAEIANALRQPHQLVTQRVEVLIALGTVERLDDPRDGRRKILRLTPQGAAQFVRMQDCLTKVARAFGDLFEEIGCDLPGSAQRVAQALEERSVHERVRSL
jgi:DNA-binding MarR family transcriptional regulator